MNTARPASVALLYPGDRAARDAADPAASRFGALFAALAAAGIGAEPAVYHDDFADEVQAQLRGARVVLVWCNPIENGRRRDRLDTMLREVANTGVLVSAHPNTILRLGTKDLLWETRDLPFGSDVQRVDSLAQLQAELPQRLRAGARVLKQQRGHSGIGVWRIEALAAKAGDAPLFALRHAQRGSEEERLDMATVLQRLAAYFEPANGGHMIDQAWQPRLTEGMVRAYLVQDQVTGFGHQAINALYPSAPGAPAVQPGQRLYFAADDARFQPLRQRLENGWIEQLYRRAGVARDSLPLLWDCDFMRGEPTPEEPARWVLCEVNVSSVSPFPPSSIDPLVQAVRSRLQAAS